MKSLAAAAARGYVGHMTVPQHATEHEAPVRERDYVAIAYGVGWFLFVMLGTFGLWLADFHVDATVQKVVAYLTVIGFGVWLVRGTPSSRLHPERRAKREARRFAGLLGGLIALLLLGGFAAAFQLHSWSEWVVLLAFVLLTIGVGLALNTHFTIGP